MNPFQSIVRVFRFFSLYANPFEKQVDRFIKRIDKSREKDLRVLIQRNLVKLTVFLEYKFKAYRKLRKGYRRKLYENARLIAKDFVDFFEAHQKDIQVRQKGLDLPDGLREDKRFTYLLGIMEYLKPGQRLQYQEAATFEKLLRDPGSEMLVGDCNQITTLYIYLYSLRFMVGDLKIKILPGHICLHYRGVDIETTTGRLADYDDYVFISKVEEIVAANLLDISDPTEKQYEISADNMLRSAQVAFHFSSHRATVEKNLFIAYHNMAVHYAKQKNFKKAAFFANKSGNTKLQKEIIRMEGAKLLQSKQYDKALEKFKRIKDRDGERVCYENQLVESLDKIKSCKTIDDYKKHRSTLDRIKKLGAKVGNREVQRFVTDIKKQF